jgi:hypothetical protein
LFENRAFEEADQQLSTGAQHPGALGEDVTQGAGLVV